MQPHLIPLLVLISGSIGSPNSINNPGNGTEYVPTPPTGEADRAWCWERNKGATAEPFRTRAVVAAREYCKANEGKKPWEMSDGERIDRILVNDEAIEQLKTAEEETLENATSVTLKLLTEDWNTNCPGITSAVVDTANCEAGFLKALATCQGDEGIWGAAYNEEEVCGWFYYQISS